MKRSLFILAGYLVHVAGLAQSADSPAWRVNLQKNGVVELVSKKTGQALRIEPTFSLFFRPDDPALTLPRSAHLVYQIPNWKRTDGRGPLMVLAIRNTFSGRLVGTPRNLVRSVD